MLLLARTADGAPADPPTFQSAIPGWAAADAITLGAGRRLVVLAVRENESDEALPVLVVEDAA